VYGLPRPMSRAPLRVRTHLPNPRISGREGVRCGVPGLVPESQVLIQGEGDILVQGKGDILVQGKDDEGDRNSFWFREKVTRLGPIRECRPVMPFLVRTHLTKRARPLDTLPPPPPAIVCECGTCKTVKARKTVKLCHLHLV
jgi:hypothetical protein